MLLLALHLRYFFEHPYDVPAAALSGVLNACRRQALSGALNACGRAAVVDRRPGSAQLSVGDKWCVRCHSQVVRRTGRCMPLRPPAKLCALVPLSLAFDKAPWQKRDARAAEGQPEHFTFRAISTFWKHWEHFGTSGRLPGGFWECQGSYGEKLTFWSFWENFHF